ncbi:MAG: right-handed parallel beta-helix repeat-containing protein [Bdellovibrionota bacterium]
MRKTIRTFCTLILFSYFAVFFQNCSAGFQSGHLNASGSSNAVSGTPPSPSNPSIPIGDTAEMVPYKNAVNVTDDASLLAAISNAKPGDGILLAPGNYERIDVKNMQFADKVIIASKDPQNPANVRAVSINGSKNVIIRYVSVHPYTDGSGIYIAGSDNIVIERLYVHGDMDGSPENDGAGMNSSTNTNLVVRNCEFRELKTGLSTQRGNNILFTKNYFHEISIDAMQVYWTSNITISKNYIADMITWNQAHKDGIQFFTSGQTTSAKNITITDNVFVRGKGQTVQGIFMGNESGVAYENVVISRNALIGPSWHGITIVIVNGLTMEDNLVQAYTDYQSWIKIGDTWGNMNIKNNHSTYFNLSDLKYGGEAEGYPEYDPVNNVSAPTLQIGDVSSLKAWQQRIGNTVDENTFKQ